MQGTNFKIMACSVIGCDAVWLVEN